MKNIIYADNAATTRLDEDAFDAMKPFMLECYANPSQPYSFSKKAKRALKDARETIAECINAKSEEIFFTSGGTESINWAIKKFALASYMRYVYASSIEHHAVLNSCSNAGELIAHRLIPVDSFGQVMTDELIKILEESSDVAASCESKLISVMHANNEIGTIQPIRELAKTAHSHGAIFHTDAVQSVGHIPIDVKELEVDMLSASAHKFNGPKGIGFLYNRSHILQPFHNGGSQEFGMRAGTENVSSIVGMAVALKKNVELIKQHTSHLNKLTLIFLSKLHEVNVDFILNGHPDNRLPGNINISIKGRSGEGLMHMLDLKGICISTGSACDSQNQQISHVIKALNVPKEYAEGTIRVSFGQNNTEQDAIDVASAIIKVTRL